MTPTTATILLVEDEESYIEALRVGLGRTGFTVEAARDGPEGLRMFERLAPDLVLLDVMLPGMSGIDVCREIRTKSRTPIIMVSARKTELDAVVGLEIGADDYVFKPFRLSELTARVRAVLRRANAEDDENHEVEALDVGDVRIDLARHEVTVRGEVVALPRKEFELLELLMLNARRVVTRDALIDRVWGTDFVGSMKTLDVHVKRVRSKIDLDPVAPSNITTIRGVGYRFEGP